MWIQLRISGVYLKHLYINYVVITWSLVDLKKKFWIFLDENHAKIQNLIKYGTCEKNM